MLLVVRSFLSSKAAPGLLLCLASLLGLLCANTSLQEYYGTFKSLPVVFQAGGFVIHKPLLLWINDGLMAIFFLLVGLEIKREVMEGHLSSIGKAVLPAIAALGGIAVPALIYSAINWGDPVALEGWAIPGATDIAFSLGVLLLLGSRIPVPLKVSLVAIAIADDLAAVLIIALFYTTQISIPSLLLAGIGLFVAFVMNKSRVTLLSPYVVVGLFVWASVLKSGVHATLAGVALGLLIPLRAQNKYGASPLKAMENTLHPWVAFGVVPVFAFANAGVSLADVTLETFLQPVTLGIMAGLFLGKQVGIMAFTALACALRICRLPGGVTWGQFYGMALLTGIGFTMSLFVGTLAFSDDSMDTAIRLGVLSGSALSAVAGVVVLLLTTRKAHTGQEALDVAQG